MTEGALVIAVDSSTTSTKAIVVDSAGGVLASGQAAIDLLTPGPDRYEHDPTAWWRTTDEAVREAVAALDPADRQRIRALAITPQRQSFALLDQAGEPVRNAILWLDGRAADEVAEYGSPEVHALTGFQPDVTPSLYKLLWLARHEPEALAGAAHVVGVHAYLVHRLTGEWADSVACADSLGLYDMARLDFAEEMLTLVGLEREVLGNLVRPGEVIGPVRDALCDDWGVTRGLPVVAGCGDGQAAALGCAAIEPGEAYLNLGTAVVGGVHSPTYAYGEVYRTDAAGLPGQYVLEIVQNSGAYLAGWFRTELGDPALDGRPDPQLDAEAAAVPAGSEGLLCLPYWNAVQSPHWDPLARGAYVGLAGHHTRPAMYRALIEGLCLETARNLRGLEQATGVPLTSVRIMGGGQRSTLWRGILSAASGMALTTCEQTEISAAGAAVLAMASATGAPIDETARRMVRLGETTEPDEDLHAIYRDLDEIQAGLYEALRPTFAAQHRLSRRAP